MKGVRDITGYWGKKRKVTEALSSLKGYTNYYNN